jgi:Clp amino terminal domain, pathogenicity island component
MTATNTIKAPGSVEPRQGDHGAPFGAALEDDMAYKGDDLDLRPPQGAGQSAYSAYGNEAEAGRSRPRTNGQYQNGANRSPALYVDEVLLACCNHAYDIASANGAREVMIEHLVHALTRVPEAAQVLENRGVHVMALRRDSAAVIANDLPISPAHSGAAVKASSDVDAVLHLAAANARLRSDRPTSVRDVLFVLMNYDRQASGIDLLRRHWASWQQDDTNDREETVRVQPPRPAAPRVPVYDPAPAEPLQADLRSSRMDTRIEALITTLHDSVIAQRNDYQNLRAALGERLQRLEKAIEHGRLDNGTANLEVAITSRLQRLEKMQETLLTQRISLAPLEATMNDRFHRLEKTLEANRFDQGKLPTGVNDRMQAMERMLEARLTEMQRTMGQAGGASGGVLNGQLGERLQRLEKAIESVTHAMPSGLIDRMQAMEKSFEAKITESMRNWGPIGERLQGLERVIEHWRKDSSAASAHIPGPLMERLSNLENTLIAWREEGGVVTGSSEVPAVLFERMQALEHAVAELRAGVTRLGGVQQNLSTAVDQWRLDNTGDLGIISNRLEAIEHSSIRPMEILESLNSRVQAMGMQYPNTGSSVAGARTVTSSVAGRAMGNGQRRGFWRWLFGLN